MREAAMTEQANLQRMDHGLPVFKGETFEAHIDAWLILAEEEHGKAEVVETMTCPRRGGEGTVAAE